MWRAPASTPACRFSTTSTTNLPEALERFDAIGMADETIGRPFPRAPRTPREFFRYWMTGEGGSAETTRADSYFDIECSFLARAGAAEPAPRPLQ